jgi:hypothetical protein
LGSNIFAFCVVWWLTICGAEKICCIWSDFRSLDAHVCSVSHPFLNPSTSVSFGAIRLFRMAVNTKQKQISWSPNDLRWILLIFVCMDELSGCRMLIVVCLLIIQFLYKILCNCDKTSFENLLISHTERKNVGKTAITVSNFSTKQTFHHKKLWFWSFCKDENCPPEAKADI